MPVWYKYKINELVSSNRHTESFIPCCCIWCSNADLLSILSRSLSVKFWLNFKLMNFSVSSNTWLSWSC